MVALPPPAGPALMSTRVGITRGQAAEMAALELCLEIVLGFTVRLFTVLIQDRYDLVVTLAYWKHSDIKDWCYQKSKPPQNRGGATYRDRHVKCLQALEW